MSFRKTYAEIVEMILHGALDTQFCRDLVRRSGVRAGQGAGVPPGGYAGQALKKSSDADGDAHWGQPGPRSTPQAYMVGAAPTIAVNWCGVNNGIVSGIDPNVPGTNGFDFNPVGSGASNEINQLPIFDMFRFLAAAEARLVLYCTAPIGLGGYAIVFGQASDTFQWPSGAPQVEMETTGLKVSGWKEVSFGAGFNPDKADQISVGFLDGADEVADVMIGVPFYQVQFRSPWIDELYTQSRFPDSPGGPEA